MKNIYGHMSDMRELAAIQRRDATIRGIRRRHVHLAPVGPILGIIPEAVYDEPNPAKGSAPQKSCAHWQAVRTLALIARCNELPPAH
jgi:hypothetical protein